MSKVLRIVMSKIIGIMIFLILLVLLNALDIKIGLYQLWVKFFTDNAPLLIIISLIFMAGELFFAFVFPFNLVAPIFSSVGAVLLTFFLFRLFLIIDRMVGVELFGLFGPLRYLIIPLVFTMVFIGGYVSIFSRLVRLKKSIKTRKTKPHDKEWEDIGNEFRKAFSDFFRKIADSLENEDKD